MGYPVYLNGQFPGSEHNQKKDTLDILINEFRKSGKTDAQIYSILIGMGIAPEKAANGINSNTINDNDIYAKNAARLFLQAISVEENIQNKNINMNFLIENIVKNIHETLTLVKDLNTASHNRYDFSVKKINDILNESLLSLDLDKANSILKSIDIAKHSLNEAVIAKNNAEEELTNLKNQILTINSTKNVLETAKNKINNHSLDENIDVNGIVNMLQEYNDINTISKSIDIDTISKSIDIVNNSINEAEKNRIKAEAELHNLENQVTSILGRRNILETVSKTRQRLHEHAWIESVKELCIYFDKIKNDNKFSMLLIESLYNMKNDKYLSLNAKPVAAIEKMIEKGENYIKENYLTLNEFSWTAPLKYTINKIADALNEMTDTSIANVQKIYSPVQVNEDDSITISLFGKFYAITPDSILEANKNQQPTARFLKTLDAMSMFSVINEEFVYHGKRKSLSIVENKIYVENTELSQTTPNAIMSALQESALTSNNSYQIAEKISFLIESFDTIKEIDIFTSLVSKQHKNVAVNIAKINENIFINRVNYAMNINEMIQTSSAKVAQGLVNEFVNYDITPLVQEMLNNEEKIAYNFKIEKNKIQETIKILENKKKEIFTNIALYPNVKELKDLYEAINLEINSQEKELQLIYLQESKL